MAARIVSSDNFFRALTNFTLTMARLNCGKHHFQVCSIENRPVDLNLGYWRTVLSLK